MCNSLLSTLSLCLLLKMEVGEHKDYLTLFRLLVKYCLPCLALPCLALPCPISLACLPCPVSLVCVCFFPSRLCVFASSSSHLACVCLLCRVPYCLVSCYVALLCLRPLLFGLACLLCFGPITSSFRSGLFIESKSWCTCLLAVYTKIRSGLLWSLKGPRP